MDPKNRNRTRLIDRFAIALFSGLSALLTASFIWFVLFFSLTQLAITDTPPPFWPVLLFTLALAVLGFLTRIDLATEILTRIWHFLYRFFRILFAR